MLRRAIRACLPLPVIVGALLSAGAAHAAQVPTWGPDWVRHEDRFLARLQEIATIHARLAIDSAGGLRICVERFLEEVTSANLELCREEWLASHDRFIRARLFARLAAHLPGAQRTTVDNLYEIDGWPIQAGYIDALPGYPTSGIVHDLTVPIGETSLRAQHGLTDRSEISLGFHPLEFLLWSRGIDEFTATRELSEAQRNEGLTEASLVNNRRRELVRLLARMLEREIARQFDLLAQEGSLADHSAYAIRAALSSTLSEGWSHLRSQVARFLSGEADGRHSRFSGRALEDLVAEASALGICIDSPGRFIEELAQLDAELAEHYLAGAREAQELIVSLGDPDRGDAAAEAIEPLLGRLIEQGQRFDQHLKLAR